MLPYDVVGHLQKCGVAIIAILGYVQTTGCRPDIPES